MTWLDLSFLLLALFSVIVGAWRGFVFELISVLGWIGGFWCAMHFGPVLGEWLPWESVGEQPRRVIGMVVTFIVAMFASSVLASLGRRFAKALGMRPADRLVGAGFGLVRVLLVGVLAAVGVHAMQWHNEPWWRDSSLAQPLSAARMQLAQWLPEWEILQESGRGAPALLSPVNPQVLKLQ